MNGCWIGLGCGELDALVGREVGNIIGLGPYCVRVCVCVFVCVCVRV